LGKEGKIKEELRPKKKTEDGRVIVENEKTVGGDLSRTLAQHDTTTRVEWLGGLITKMERGRKMRVETGEFRRVPFGSDGKNAGQKIPENLLKTPLSSNSKEEKSVMGGRRIIFPISLAKSFHRKRKNRGGGGLNQRGREQGGGGRRREKRVRNGMKRVKVGDLQ